MFPIVRVTAALLVWHVVRERTRRVPV